MRVSSGTLPRHGSVTEAETGRLPKTTPSELPQRSVAGLRLVRVLRIAAQEIGQRHPQRAVLHLPDVAELVRDELLVGEQPAGAEQDRLPRGVAVEAPEPREPEEPRDDPDPDAAERHRLRIERQAVEPLLRPRERLTLLRLHEPTL